MALPMVHPGGISFDFLRPVRQAHGKQAQDKSLRRHLPGSTIRQIAFLTESILSFTIHPMLKIRLRRRGKNKYATYRIVVAQHSAPIKGKFIADLGFYNPHSKEFSI